MFHVLKLCLAFSLATLHYCIGSHYQFLESQLFYLGNKKGVMYPNLELLRTYSWLHTQRSLRVVLKGPYVVEGIESGLVVYKVNLYKL